MADVVAFTLLQYSRLLTPSLTGGLLRGLYDFCLFLSVKKVQRKSSKINHYYY